MALVCDGDAVMLGLVQWHDFLTVVILVLEEYALQLLVELIGHCLGLIYKSGLANVLMLLGVYWSMF